MPGFPFSSTSPDIAPPVRAVCRFHKVALPCRPCASELNSDQKFERQLVKAAAPAPALHQRPHHPLTAEETLARELRRAREEVTGLRDRALKAEDQAIRQRRACEPHAEQLEHQRKLILTLALGAAAGWIIAIVQALR